FAALRFNSARISIAAFTGCAILWLVLNVLPAAARRLGLPKDVQKRVNPVTLQPAVFIFGLVLILLSDFAARRFGYFSDAASPALVMYLGSFAVILLLLHRRLNEQTRWTDVIATWPVLLFCQAAVAASFFHYANGRILFSDDHPSFIYRLHLLAEHFPFIPHYNTDWNAGYGTTELFSTGPLNLFLAAAPILYFMHGFASYGAAAFYTEIIGVLFIGIIPLCVVSAARLFGLHNKVALTAALLILAPTTGLFEWLLKYGTVPFALAAGLAPLTVALIYRLALAPQRPRAAHAVGLFIAGTLCMFWSLSAIVFLPAAIIAFSSPKVTFAADRRRLVAAFLALFILCNGLWFWRLASELDVFSFVKSSSMVGMNQHKSKEEANALSTANTAATALVKKKPGKSLVQIAQTTKKKFLQSGSKFNPLVLLFFIPGIAVAPRGTARKVLATTTFWLLFVAIIGDQYKPQLELKRMAVNASYFMSIFAACAIIEVISRLEKLCSEPAVPWNLRRIVPALGAAVVLGFLFFTPFTAAAAYGNRSWEKFTFSPPIVKDLSAAIREHGGSGRTFIFDFVLHELGSTSWNAQDGGHIAPL
ncbi:MAG TPA: hypothetical protein PLP17_11025, partial [Oligoflexia bacterium]|nr:hypothetical protein [Oligoflexia bacterium]